MFHEPLKLRSWYRYVKLISVEFVASRSDSTKSRGEGYIVPGTWIKWDKELLFCSLATVYAIPWHRRLGYLLKRIGYHLDIALFGWVCLVNGQGCTMTWCRCFLFVLLPRKGIFYLLWPWISSCWEFCLNTYAVVVIVPIHSFLL